MNVHDLQLVVSDERRESLHPQKQPSRKQNDSQWQDVSCKYETQD